jgi:hypothetical protein
LKCSDTNKLNDDKLDNQKLKDALSRAYALRSFEIEHYWKRATFFWGFQAAIFAAFGFVWKDSGGPTQSGPLVLGLSSLGILTAIANYLSARGSKFWQKNWEKHIDMLEDEVEGRLHKTIWLPEGLREYSVSGVNLMLGRFFIVFWIIVAGYSASRFLDWHLSAIISSLPSFLRAVTAQWMYVIAFFVLTILGAIFLRAQTSTLKGTIATCTGGPGRRLADWNRGFARLRRRVEPAGETILVRRDAPDEQ